MLPEFFLRIIKNYIACQKLDELMTTWMKYGLLCIYINISNTIFRWKSTNFDLFLHGNLFLGGSQELKATLLSFTALVITTVSTSRIKCYIQHIAKGSTYSSVKYFPFLLNKIFRNFIQVPMTQSIVFDYELLQKINFKIHT